MTLVKDAPRTSTTIMIRSESNSRVSHSRDPYHELMRRLFQEEKTELMPVEGLIDTKGLNLNFETSFDIQIIDVSSKQVIGTIHFNKDTGELSYSVITGNLEFEIKDKK